MPLPPQLANFVRYPGMFVTPVSFETITAFLTGFDSASGNTALRGFQEWLVLRLGTAFNATWPLLVLLLAFPNTRSPYYRLRGTGQKTAINCLFGLLEEFFAERTAPGGLASISARYQEWLKTRDLEDTSFTPFTDE